MYHPAIGRVSYEHAPTGLGSRDAPRSHSGETGAMLSRRTKATRHGVRLGRWIWAVRPPLRPTARYRKRRPRFTNSSDLTWSEVELGTVPATRIFSMVSHRRVSARQILDQLTR